MGTDLLIVLGILVLVWWLRRRVQYKVAERAVQTAELVSKCEEDAGKGHLTGGQKKKIAVDAFLSWIPRGFTPLTPLGLDLLIEHALQRLKRRTNLS